jgi:hypothetical protein
MDNSHDKIPSNIQHIRKNQSFQTDSNNMKRLMGPKKMKKKAILFFTHH